MNSGLVVGGSLEHALHAGCCHLNSIYIYICRTVMDVTAGCSLSRLCGEGKRF